MRLAAFQEEEKIISLLRYSQKKRGTKYVHYADAQSPIFTSFYKIIFNIDILCNISSCFKMIIAIAWMF